MRQKTIYTLLLLVCVVGFWLFENFYTPATYSRSSDEVSLENRDFSLLPSSTSDEIVHHEYYSLSYKERFEQAEWVAYDLKKQHLTHDDRRRPYFIEDPKVRSKSADWRNYKRSGFDRGHLCPAGDRRFSEYAYKETFYTSNISPQRNDFNAGVWNRLEQQVRYWCKKYGDLYIVAGGVLKSGLEEIGDEDVDVPDAFYKIVVRTEGSQIKALGFLFPHRESTANLDTFLVPIDRIEELTGVNFFEQQSNSWQEQIESEIRKSGWKF